MSMGGNVLIVHIKEMSVPREGQPVKMGGPLKWETPEDLHKVIVEYFDSVPIKEWTVTGLALELGTWRSTVQNYMKRPEYSEIVEEAKKFIEHSYELDVKRDGRAGSIFALKNMGWKDQQQVDTTNRITVINEVVKADNGSNA